MDLVPALVAGLGLPLVTLVAGLAWKARDGRVRTVEADVSGRAASEARRTADDLGLAADRLGADATLVQFSTEYCSRCPATARALGALADEYDGVRHVEIDLTRDPALADRFRVTQTPTVLVLDADGSTAGRIAGVPRTGDLRTLIDDLTRRNRVPHHA
ncbi:thioredoxin family protein [Agromyces aurantiacus]|uniref:Thioredoxin family protein n=1 Tax=Agromyces aurantiacus TaxID=165814 RepID=A0ABV9R8Z7_9MICO|nr:thioredoxin family protein [Agromyces aurantiacus]MBM7504460.1 thiol-disulfide isomerase/thioredoxin [Agromyces aurantiacus]